MEGVIRGGGGYQGWRGLGRDGGGVREGWRGGNGGVWKG